MQSFRSGPDAAQERWDEIALAPLFLDATRLAYRVEFEVASKSDLSHLADTGNWRGQLFSVQNSLAASAP